MKGETFSNEPIKNDIETYENFEKTATGQGDYYTTGCLWLYNWFDYKLIKIDLTKQQVLHSDQIDCKSRA